MTDYSTAHCVRITKHGGPEVLEVSAWDPGDRPEGHVTVAVKAAGLNRADTLQRRGFYPAPKGSPVDVPGLEIAGEVLDGGCGFRRGERVMAIVSGGGMSTHLHVHAEHLIRIPSGLSFEDAAAVPEVFMTAFDALYEQAGVTSAHSVLVHSIGSGIGTAALQMLNRTGATVFGTSRTAEKLDKAQEVGPFTAVHSQEGVFAKLLLEHTGGVDRILDTVGGAYLAENIKVLNLRGHMVVIGLLGGAKAELSLGALLGKRATITGSVLRSRSDTEKAKLVTAFCKHVVPGFSDGSLAPVIDAVLPMSQVQDAHQRMDKNDTFGKIVLSW